MLLARSATGSDPHLLGGGPGGVGGLGRLAVVYLLTLAPPQAPPIFVIVAVSHVAELIRAWRGEKTLTQVFYLNDSFLC